MADPTLRDHNGASNSDTFRGRLEYSLHEALLFAQLARLKSTESTSGWLLLITGATFPLLFANTKALLLLLSPQLFKAVLTTLTLSAVVGGLVKYRAMLVAEIRDGYTNLLARFEDIKRTEREHFVRTQAESERRGSLPPSFTPMDVRRIFDAVDRLKPRFLRVLFPGLHVASLSPDDMVLASFQQAVRLSWSVHIYFLLQLVLFLLVPILFAIGM